MTPISKPIYTKREALKLLNSLKEIGYTWRSGASLSNSSSTEDFLRYLPCDVFIRTDKKYFYCDTDLINGSSKE